MTMTQRGALSPDDEQRLRDAQAAVPAAEAEFRRVCLEMVEKGSLRVVRDITGKSTNTLQRWKREAGSDF